MGTGTERTVTTTHGGCPLSPSWCDREAKTAPAPRLHPLSSSATRPQALRRAAQRLGSPGHRRCSACPGRLCQPCLITPPAISLGCCHPRCLQAVKSPRSRDPSAGHCLFQPPGDDARKTSAFSLECLRLSGRVTFVPQRWFPRPDSHLQSQSYSSELT